MNQRLLNQKVYEQVENWRKTGEYQYIAILNFILGEHTKKTCFPDGDDFIYLPTHKYSKVAAIIVMDSLEIEYSTATICSDFLAIRID